MKTGAKVLVGCLAAPFVLVLLLALSVLSFRLVPMAESRPEKANLEQNLPGNRGPDSGPADAGTVITESQLAAEGLVPAEKAPTGPVLQVNMLLEEGSFTIVPAAAGTPIRIEGDYDSGAYELKQNLEGAGTDTPVYTVSFRPRYSMLRRILSHGGVHMGDGMNPITIHVPRGVPISLNARILKGESRLDLGGLALTKVQLDVSMGEHSIEANQPNPVEMESFVLNTGMGEFRSTSLGNLRAGEITVHGKMGEVGLDLGDTIHRDTKVYARMKMGEMRIGVPTDARLKSRTSVFLGDSQGPSDDPGEAEEESTEEPEPKFQLDVDASASMGELRLQRNGASNRARRRAL